MGRERSEAPVHTPSTSANAMVTAGRRDQLPTPGDHVDVVAMLPLHRHVGVAPGRRPVDDIRAADGVTGD
ncbi:hypothetical protein ACQP1K_19580 [Sphaerimonospora sp. CA-214678]|uniref:hypothetical protein n=1 Tax=Sphaerimonospora sp. CA-214678 TaxID=3240029 RepID=UPI003D8AD50B